MDYTLLNSVSHEQMRTASAVRSEDTRDRCSYSAFARCEKMSFFSEPQRFHASPMLISEMRQSSNQAVLQMKVPL